MILYEKWGWTRYRKYRKFLWCWKNIYNIAKILKNQDVNNIVILLTSWINKNSDFFWGDFVKKENKEIKITGYDIAYYASIITIIASIILAVFQFINKTNEWDKVFMFFIFGFIGYYTNKENRKKEKNKDK